MFLFSARALFSSVAIIACLLCDSAMASDVTLKLKGEDGETASVVLNMDTGMWAGTNGPSGDLLNKRSGRYKSGTNLTPGFAVKGTALFIGSDGKELEVFLYDLDPAESVVANGKAQMLGVTKTGRWTRQ
ncbi:hypothetical protein AB9E28_00245 [Rhizobium leguminosarum]|uniref:hypothetical protein n=1 Tax=Rhizobium leguminosarum TaxID=384 RepID=UPI003F9549A4